MSESFPQNYNVSKLIETISYYLPSSELDSVYKAVEIAHHGHEGYFRYDDSAYFLHPIGVAQILAEWKAPAKVLVAGLLHDIKKTHYSGLNFQEVTKNFSSEIVDLIEEVNAIDTRFDGDTGEFRVDIHNNSMDKKALWVNAIMRKRPQALIVKIADRLHNSLSINNLPETRKGSFASNSINLFSAISYRLGMANAMRQLQDQSFKGINSSGYDESDEIYNSAKLWPQVSELVETVRNALNEKGISARVFPYYTHRYGIHKRKMEGNGKRLQPSEIVSIVVVTENCYVALEPIHKNFQVLHEIKDYIAEPKANGYRALHTKLLKMSWGTFQVCILSDDMYKVAEYGLTAAWQGVDTQLLPTIEPLAPAPQKSIMVFTPAGKAVYLPENSCVIDFAYAIHPSLGNRTMFAQVDGRDVPLETILKEGNVVEVITGKGIVGPDTKWLSFVRTDAAKNYIKTWKQKRTKVDLRITAYDRVGLMTEVSSVISSKGYNMKTFRAMSADDGNADIYFRLEDVESKELEKIKAEIENIPNIIEVKLIHDEEFNKPVEFSKVLSSIRNNPFSTQRPATNTFKGREIEINQILRKISGVEKSNTLLIWGQKRIGKTSLLKHIEMHIASLKRGNILPVYIDLQGIPDAPVEKLLFEIMQAVDEKLGSPNISCPNYRRFTIDPLQHFIAFIRTVKKYKKDVRILIIMDEFQGIDKLTEEKLSKSDFFFRAKKLNSTRIDCKFYPQRWRYSAGTTEIYGIHRLDECYRSDSNKGT